MKLIPLALMVAALGAAAAGQAQKPDHMEHRFTNAEAWAKSFDDPARDAWQKPDDVIAALDLKPGMVVADLGAGTGYFSVRLAKSAAKPRVLAVDLEPDMVAYLTRRAADEQLANMIAVQATATDSRLPERVDRVLIVDTYHHIGARVDYFRRLRSNLKPGGRVVLVDFRPDGEMGPPREFRQTPAECEPELRRAGYRLATSFEFLKYQQMLVFEVAR